MALKPALTFEERIKAAYLHYVLGVEQQAIAAAFEVNHGRVTEACLAIKAAAGAYKEDVTRPSAKQRRRTRKEIGLPASPVTRKE